MARSADTIGVKLAPVSPAERALLAVLMDEFYRHEKMTLDGRVRSAALKLLRTPELGRVYLIRADGEPVGYCVLTWLFSLEYGGRCGLLDELYIRPAARGRGIGTRVLELLRRAAQREGAAALHLEVGAHNMRARRLYRRLGFAGKRRGFWTLRL